MNFCHSYDYPYGIRSKKSGKTPPSDRIVMGGIGVGGMGTGDMKHFLKNKDVRYVAVWVLLIKSTKIKIQEATTIFANFLKKREN